MGRTYYSTVFDCSATSVWAVIRSFGDYAWAGADADAHIEGSKAGDAVGAVRRIGSDTPPIRERLLAHSDLDRSYTYEFCDPCPFPIDNYQATLRVTPVTDGDRAFVEWWATFDCAEQEREHWTTHFEQDGFARWLDSLRARVIPGGAMV